MKAQEQVTAHKSLRKNGQAFFVATYEECDRIIEALEKQIPKKPIIESAHYVDFDDFLCPFCKNKIISRLDGKWTVGTPQKYCGECGQALDWSEEKE